MLTINMKSSANSIKGQGVASCYDEQVALMKTCKGFQITENGHGRCDITHYHTVNPGFFLERLLHRKCSVGVGYVHFLPCTLENSLRLPHLFRKIFYKYLLAFYNSMDYLVTVNPYFVQKIKSYGITAPEVLCIPNFVDDKDFHPLSVEEIECGRLKYGIDKDRFTVLGVGQLQTRKGVLDFIETARRLPNIQFVWVGGFSFGRISDGYDEIIAAMDKLPENVRFLGIIDRSEMNMIYNIADVFFLPSFDELFPMSILEALCGRKPVVVRDLPLYDYIVFDECQRGDSVENFVQIIESLANNEEEYSMWAEKAWKCHRRYTKEQAATQWSNFYRSAYNGIFNNQHVHHVREGLYGYNQDKC